MERKHTRRPFPADPALDLDAVLAASERSALLTLTRRPDRLVDLLA